MTIPHSILAVLAVALTAIALLLPTRNQDFTNVSLDGRSQPVRDHGRL
jgi:hypothetical protein